MYMYRSVFRYHVHVQKYLRYRYHLRVRATGEQYKLLNVQDFFTYYSKEAVFPTGSVFFIQYFIDSDPRLMTSQIQNHFVCMSIKRLSIATVVVIKYAGIGINPILFRGIFGSGFGP